MCIYIDIHIRILCFMIVIYIYVYQYYIYSNLYIYDYTCTQSIQSSHMDFYPSSFLHAWKHEEKPTDWPDTSKTCGSPSPSNRSNQFRSGEINGSPMPMTSGKQEGVSMRNQDKKRWKRTVCFFLLYQYIYAYNIYISMFLDRMKNNCWRWSCPMGGQETSLVTHLIVTHLNNIVFVVYIFIALSPLFGGLQPTQSISVLHSPRFPKWLIFHWGTIKE